MATKIPILWSESPHIYFFWTYSTQGYLLAVDCTDGRAKIGHFRSRCRKALGCTMIRLKNCRGLTPFYFFTLLNLWLTVSIAQILTVLIFTTKKIHTKLLSKLYIYLRSSQPPYLSTLVCTEPRFSSIKSIAIISQHRQHQRWCPFFKTCTF